MHRLLVLLPALWIAGAAFSQASAPLDGKWSVKWTGAGGNEREAELELKGDAGFYKIFQRQVRGRGKLDPCDELRAPVVVEPAADGQVTITARYSQSLTGCQDRTIKAGRVDDRTFKGTLSGTSEATPVVLTRQ
ncbi:MAG: hypothetical protein JWQ07_3329 [Ramlibacter sp.]|nr:hypothetical protein [Ramlibacter sp.]